MWPSPRRPASRRARSSMTGDRSTAVTEPGRRASGRASRPRPHPYSSIDIGANCGASPASMTAQHPRHDGLAAREELALVFRGQVGAEEFRIRQDGEVRLARRERLAARDLGLLNTCSIDPQRQVTLVRRAGAAGHEELRALEDDLAVRAIEEIGGQRDRPDRSPTRDRTRRPRDRRSARGRAARRRSSAAATRR